MTAQQTIAPLVEEYRTLFATADVADKGTLTARLNQEGDWTVEASSHLMTLAEDYGSFMLRNALAISLALEIEDGQLGF